MKSRNHFNPSLMYGQLSDDLDVRAEQINKHEKQLEDACDIMNKAMKTKTVVLHVKSHNIFLKAMAQDYMNNLDKYNG